MTRVLYSLALIIIPGLTLIAQNPTNIITKAHQYPEAVLACPPGQQNNAGTVALGPFTGQSNDVNLNTMYLCFGDQVLIDHVAGSENLSGDPDPATQAGVGYAFYTCVPGINGPDLSSIQADACLADNPPPTNGIYIATGGNTSGDVLFENTGFLQEFFNAGAPVLLHFAPITYDALSDSIAVYEGNPAGPCVNVNTDESFAVVYLNEISISNVNNAVDGNGCTGSFQVNGGLPEFDNSSYDIAIVLQGDTSVQAFEQGVTPSHGQVQSFKVFKPGTYDIIISDNKGCTSVFEIDMSGCETIGLDIGDEIVGNTGDTVCVPITAYNFTDIASFQFTILFDNTLLNFLGSSNQSALLTDNGISPVTFGPLSPNTQGLITCNWLDVVFDGQTVPDSTVIFELCFEALGPNGSVADLSFDYFPTTLTPIEIKYVVAPFEFEDLGLDGQDGSVTVSGQNPVQVGLNVQNVSCNGGTDGGFSITASGGQAPYIIVYSKSGGGPLIGPDTIFTEGGTLQIEGLNAGLYLVTTADNSNPAFVRTDSVIITQPPFPLGVGPDISGFQEPLCFGDSSAAFPIKISGGTTPYSFLWNTGQQVEDLINIPSGFYEVTVTDVNGCEAIASATLADPPQLFIGLNGQDAACEGVDNGTVVVTATGGTLVNADYGYSWNTTPPSFGNSINNLSPGTYKVTVTDDNACTVSDSIVVGSATTLSINATSNLISCFNAGDGSISLAPSATGINNGGYTYFWNPVVAGTNDNIAANLNPGNYAFTITDAAGCIVDSNIVLTQPDDLVVSLVNKTDEGCGGNDGAITVSATGGTLAPGSTYLYNWGTQQGNTISGLSNGTYTVTVSDLNNCMDTLAIQIAPPNNPVIASFSITDVPCASSTNGVITANIIPGGAPISTINWSNNQTGSSIINLSPGWYTVTVTAADGCQVVDSALVDAPLPINVIDTILNQPLCSGECNGSISVALTGGTQPYSYQWSSGQATNPVFNLCAGNYTLTVTDANFCPSFVLELALPNPTPLDAQVTDIVGVSCFNGLPCDGQAAAQATGGGAGTGDYVYSWSSGTIMPGTTSMVNNLCQDEQTVIVSDANGCTDTVNFVVPSPSPVSLNQLATSLTPATCNGDADGSATLVGAGGTPGPGGSYTYFWPFNNSSSPTQNNLPAGIYSIEITDNNGCIGTDNIEISQPDPLIALLDSLSNVTCFDGNDGAIRIVRQGGNPGPVTYAWSGNAGSGPLIGGLTAGSYTVTLTDVDGCTGDGSFLINQPPPLLISFDSFPGVRCYGETVQLSIDTVSGGNGGPYDVFGESRIKGYVVYPDNGKLLGGVPGGQSTVVVKDIKGCEAYETIFIDEPAPVEVAIEANGFFGQNEVEIDMGDSILLNLNFVQVFEPVDTVFWSPEGTYTNPNNDLLSILVKPLQATEYTAQVFDINGCTGSASIRILVDRNRNVYIPNIFSPNDDGRNDFFEIAIGPGVKNINFMQIYDRWGALIYEARNFLPELNNSVRWDGTHKGKKLPPAAFVYLVEVEFLDGTTLLYRGTVSIVR